MLYLDNAATSFPKPRGVSKAVKKCIDKYCGNPSRSSHFYSVKAAEQVYLTRESIANEFGINEPERVVFTVNATYSLNTAIKCLISAPCHVLISDLEHNSVLRPLVKLSESVGITFSRFDTDGDIAGNLEEALTPDTRAIVSTLSSNVTGKTIPPDIISNFASRHGLISIADASQLAGHRRIDLSAHPFTALCAPGHKALFGTQGVGFIILDKNVSADTLVEGGSGASSLSPTMPDYLPERFEAGTLPTPAIVGLRQGLRYIDERGIDDINVYLYQLTEYCRERLCAIKNMQIFGAENGIVSFRIAGVCCDELARSLDERGICVRSGLHCAPLVHRKLGTIKTGLIRISFSALSKRSDADMLCRTLKDIL